MRILGIETSCDETAAAVVEDGKILHSNVIASSMDLHIAYGGVVPEIAARSHLEAITPVIHQALYEAKYGQATDLDEAQGAGEQRTEDVQNGTLKEQPQPATPRFTKSTQVKAGLARLDASAVSGSWDGIDAIAVTYGPGLSGSLLIGVLTARTLAITKQKPLYAINHVEAHAYANFITEVSSLLPTPYSLPPTAPKFPLLALIVSGGHTQLVLFQNHFDYLILGQTADDAVGEAFDKVAKILGLPYPGGPSIWRAAENGDPLSVKLPKSKMENRYDFSFSGLKTAVLRASQSMTGKDYTFPSHKLSALLSSAQKADIAASFQLVALEILVDHLQMAAEEFSPASIVIGGGVAANQELRRLASQKLSQPVGYTDIKLCTDNAAMVAALGFFKTIKKQPKADPYSLEITPDLVM